ncbi:hypothetical protein CP973_17220 [Streptomyces albofaciens JCM 4342]|nr:hypothetical protein CP973_17220 [Streptomyces albofaciens JCM 4342]
MRRLCDDGRPSWPDEARRRWGVACSARRFRSAVLSPGSPPLGLLPAALAEQSEFPLSRQQ